MVGNVLVMCLLILGFLFPVQLIKAIRGEDKEETERHTILSSLCFGFILLIIGMFLNTAIHM